MVIIADCIKFFGEVCIGDMPICFTDIYSPIGYRPAVSFPVIVRTYRPSDAGDNHGTYNKMD